MRCLDSIKYYLLERQRAKEVRETKEKGNIFSGDAGDNN